MEKKKNKKRQICCRAILVMGMITCLLVLDSAGFLGMVSLAEKEQEETTTESVSDLKNEYNNLKTNKENAKDLLEAFKSEKANVVSYIAKLDEKLNSLEDDIASMQEQKSGISEYLEKVQKELSEDKQKVEQQYSAMKRRIKYLYEHGSNNYLDVVTGSESFGDMLNRAAYVSRIQKYDNALLATYRKALASISEKEQIISEKNLELAQITLDLETEKEAVEALIEDKSEELKYYNNNIEAAGNLIDSYEASIKEQENKIEQAEAAANDYSDEMYAQLPEEYSGGKFLWPAPGYYTITSNYGYRIHPLTGTKTLHGGIDIGCPTGTSVYAGASGVVSIAEYSSSAGNYIMINHGGGLCTVYMHNSKLLVSKGDTVKKGQKIALSGSTGWSTGPHLHFGVRKNGAYVNPIPYLKSTKSSDEEDYNDTTTSSDDDSDSKTPTSEVQPSDTSTYTTEADDSGDNKDKSSDLKDDSDPDSE